MTTGTRYTVLGHGEAYIGTDYSPPRRAVVGTEEPPAFERAQALLRPQFEAVASSVRALKPGQRLDEVVVELRLNERFLAKSYRPDDLLKNTGLTARGMGTWEQTLDAARAALAAAGVDGASIDLIVLATATPDQTFPATATIVQDAIGANGGMAFDVAAVCSGFLYAVGIADSMLRTGMANRALVIGAETFSRILDWTDRGTCVLFGDGAGAIVLEAQEQPGTTADRGVLTSNLRSDGAHREKLYVDGGPSTTGTVGHLRMEGREVFKHAVGMITDVIVDAFNATGASAEAGAWRNPS